MPVYSLDGGLKARFDGRMTKTFRPRDVDQAWLLPASVHDFVPPEHLAHLVRELNWISHRFCQSTVKSVGSRRTTRR